MCESPKAPGAIVEAADMAEEAMSYAKAQVMQQASQGMLAQKNERVANVLTLLQ